jgi:hypothetical protein
MPEKTRPSGPVLNSSRCERSIRVSGEATGTRRHSPAARDLRCRCSRRVPWSVHSAPISVATEQNRSSPQLSAGSSHLPVPSSRTSGGRMMFGTVALVDRGWPETGRATARRTTSVFAGFRFPPEVILLAVRWYLRYGLSYRDVEELLAERGITVDHVSVYLWVQRFTLEFIEAARPCRHAPGGRWFADETYLKVAGTWTYLPGGRSAWPGHRPCCRLGATWQPPGAFHPAVARRHGPGRGHDRPRPCLPAGARRAGSPGAAHRGAVRE